MHWIMKTFPFLLFWDPPRPLGSAAGGKISGYPQEIHISHRPLNTLTRTMGAGTSRLLKKGGEGCALAVAGSRWHGQKKRASYRSGRLYSRTGQRGQAATEDGSPPRSSRKPAAVTTGGLSTLVRQSETWKQPTSQKVYCVVVSVRRNYSVKRHVHLVILESGTFVVLFISYGNRSYCTYVLVVVSMQQARVVGGRKDTTEYMHTTPSASQNIRQATCTHIAEPTSPTPHHRSEHTHNPLQRKVCRRHRNGADSPSQS